MSKFNTYAQRVDALARDVFSEYQAVENRLRDAESRVKQFPQRFGSVDPDYMLKSSRAAADLAQARMDIHNAQMKMNDGISAISAIRRQLAQALDDEYAARPGDIDAGIMELLRCGILDSSEYARLMNSAGNTTMRRIISKYAADAAEEASRKYGESDRRAMELRAVAYQGGGDPVGDKLARFDVLSFAYERSVGNPSMIGNWAELTAGVVESF